VATTPPMDVGELVGNVRACWPVAV
jgi:hypothetical protein